MFEDLIDYVVVHMRRDIEAVIVNPTLTVNNKRGDIGELFMYQSIKLILSEYGLVFRRGQPCSFYEVDHYGRGHGRRGVDLRLDIVDSRGQGHTFLIESKNNRDDYNLTPYDFKEDILTRFEPYDEEHRWHWMVTLNDAHIDDVGRLCLACGIDIIPLDVVFSPEPGIDELTRGMRAFTTRFMELILSYVNCQECARDNPRIVKDYIRRGIPPRIISSRCHVSEKTIMKYMSEMRKAGEDIPDWRGELGKQMKELSGRGVGNKYSKIRKKRRE
jgi:hypothetical protein